MANSIIGIALERDVRMVPLHPHVERIVEKEVSQDRANHPTLRRPSVSADKAPVRHLHRRFQPSLDVHQHPRAIRVLAHRPHEQIRVYAVEEGPDIKIKNPGMAPTSLPRHTDRIECRFSGPVSVGIPVELRLQKRFQEPFDHHLGDAIGNCGNSQRPRLAIAFGMSTRRTGGGK